MHKVRMRVKSVAGYCSAGYKEGDSLIFEEPNIIPETPGHICYYAIPSFITYLNAFVRDTDEKDWINKLTVLQCPDAKNTVVFEVERLT